ncbi:MAG: MBL fold metallo-hydrolase [Ideonella sp.]
MTVFERGWLSSNNVLFHGHRGSAATLVDSSHCLHAEQTIALVRTALDGEPLGSIVNTHLHSDHCGGNAALQRVFGVPVAIPAGSWEAVAKWDEQVLTFTDVAQRIERFEAQQSLAEGDELQLGARRWQVIAAPGHDPDALMLFEPQHGVLISGDALWQNGFGVVFPELDGKPGFDDVASVLDRIADLPVRWVIPGHGSPFDDVGAALARARSRLAAFRADPEKHARHGAKVLLKYHLMEEQAQSVDDLHRWADAAPLLHRVWLRLQQPAPSVHDWCDELLADLARSGAARLRDGIVSNA